MQKKKLYLNEFDIFRFLIENSSENKPVSVNDISVYFSRCIEFAEEEGIEDFHSLSARDFAEIYQDVSKNSDASDINESVRTYVKRAFSKFLGKEILPSFIIKSNSQKSRNTSSDRIYYIETPFSETQIILLRDAISVFPYAEINKTEKIINSLNQLTPVYNREKYSPEIVYADKFRGSYYTNLEEIRKAFSSVFLDESNNKKSSKKSKSKKTSKKSADNKSSKKSGGKIKKLEFTYCKYDENKELVPAIRNGTATRVVNPVKIMWANGYYYLVALTFENDKARFINFRIDRMKDVKCLSEDAVPFQEYLPSESKRALDTKGSIKNCKMTGKAYSGGQDRLDKANRFDESGFSVGQYRSAHPIMYSEQELSDVKIKCKISLMNNAIDTFGFEFPVTRTDDPDEIIITLHHIDKEGVKLWVMEYGDSCEVLEPVELRNEIRDIVTRMSDKYHK